MPLKNFPASIPAAKQARIRTETLDAIANEVLPAYTRFARFLEVSYIPAGRDKPGIDAFCPTEQRSLPIPHQAHHHNRPDRRSDSPDRPRRGRQGRGCDAGHRAELGFKDLASFRASP